MEEVAPSPLVPKGDEERAATIRILNTAFSHQDGLEVCVKAIILYLPRPRWGLD